MGVASAVSWDCDGESRNQMASPTNSFTRDEGCDERRVAMRGGKHDEGGGMGMAGWGCRINQREEILSG